jgi:acetyl-CoA acetyltransferase
MRALADARIAAKDIDGVVPLGGYLFTDDLIAGLRLSHNIFDAAPPPGGNSAVHSLAIADAMLTAGRANAVLIVLARNGASSHRINSRSTQLPGQEFRRHLERPQGWSVPAEWYAMMCRRHMYEFGTTKTQLASVALAASAHAQLNPRAMRYGRPITAERYHTARVVADPYQLYDCCLETDGAAALVVTSGRNKPRGAAASVRVIAVESDRPDSPDDLTNRQNWNEIGLTYAARRAYERSGVSPTDLDAAMIYDCFTFEVIHQLEEAGFCARGEGGRLAASGDLNLGGRLPINTHGGLLAEGHLGGIGHIIEAVRQIRGTAEERQLPRARLLAVTGWGDWGDGSMAILQAA